MKKKILLMFLLLILTLPLNVKALSVDKNDLTLEKGSNENIDLYANVETEVSEISFTLVYTTYDVPAYFNLESGLTDTNPNGIAHKIIFSNPVSGKVKLGSIRIETVSNPKVSVGTINIHSASATTTNGSKINLNAQTINVTIGEETEQEEPTQTTNEDEEPKTDEKKTNLLDKIESKLVTINLKENTYEYTVKIKDDIEELDLKAIPKDEKYKVEISTQKISELKDNKIVITVKDGDNTEEYTIKVNIQEEKEIEIDEEEFESSYKYKGKWITLIIIMSVVLVIGLSLIKKK